MLAQIIPTMKNIVTIFNSLSLTGVAIVAFSHFMIELFGVSIPNLFWPVFKDIGAWMILGIAFIFAIGYQINHKVSIKYLLSSNDFLFPLLIYSIGFLISVHFSFSPIDSLFSFFQIIFIFIVIYYSLFLQTFSETYIKQCIET